MAEIKLKKQTNKPSLKSMSLIKWDGLEGWMGKMLSEMHWIGSMSEEHGSVVFDLMQSFMSAEVGPSSGLGLFEDRAFIRVGLGLPYNDCYGGVGTHTGR